MGRSNLARTPTEHSPAESPHLWPASEQPTRRGADNGTASQFGLGMNFFCPVHCGLLGIDHVLVALDAEKGVRLSRTREPRDDPNPNAPTGIALPRAELARLAGKRPAAVVVINEACVNFGGDTAIPLIRDYPNLSVDRHLAERRARNRGLSRDKGWPTRSGCRCWSCFRKRQKKRSVFGHLWKSRMEKCGIREGRHLLGDRFELRQEGFA